MLPTEETTHAKLLPTEETTHANLLLTEEKPLANLLPSEEKPLANLLPSEEILENKVKIIFLFWSKNFILGKEKIFQTILVYINKYYDI